MINLKVINPKVTSAIKIVGGGTIVIMAGLIMLPALTMFFVGIGRLISWVVAIVLVTSLISYLGVFIFKRREKINQPDRIENAGCPPSNPRI